jgi:hypothetical protein
MPMETSQNAAEGGNQDDWLVKNKFYNLFVGEKAGKELKSSIEKAEKSIKIASPWVSAEEINFLEKCSSKNNIKVITSADNKLENIYHVNGLKALIHKEKMGYTPIFDTIFFRGSFFHAKFYIIDDEVAYVGSLNFTEKGMDKSIESCILFKDIETVQKLSNYFDKLFTANKDKWAVTDLVKKINDKLSDNANKSNNINQEEINKKDNDSSNNKNYLPTHSYNSGWTNQSNTKTIWICSRCKNNNSTISKICKKCGMDYYYYNDYSNKQIINFSNVQNIPVPPEKPPEKYKRESSSIGAFLFLYTLSSIGYIIYLFVNKTDLFSILNKICLLLVIWFVLFVRRMIKSSS